MGTSWQLGMQRQHRLAEINVFGVRRISRREWHEMGKRLEAHPSVPFLPTVEPLAQALKYWVACVSVRSLGSLGFRGVHGEVFSTMMMWHQGNRHPFLGSKVNPPGTQKSLQDRWLTAVPHMQGKWVSG